MTKDAAVWTEPPARVGWGAIFAGTVAALAIWMMLNALGMALGLSSIDPQDPGSLRSSGAFTGIWGIIVSLIALFVGGLVASRGSGGITKGDGVLQGLVMWGLATLIGAWLVVSVISTLLGGVAAVGKTAVETGGAAIAGAARGADQMGGLANALGFDAQAALAPVNDRLRAAGQPTITAQQLEAASKDIVQEAVRQGRFDRELLMTSIAQNTALSRADAEEVATRIEQQIAEARSSAGETMARAADTVETGALQAAEATSKAFWGLFGALFLGMLAAVGGAALGVSKRQRIWAEHHSEPTEAGFRHFPPPREAHT